MSVSSLGGLRRGQRLTRQESREVTRSRLLEAAGDVFAERGFGGASVELISERAGYTRGAFYSNFSDKDEALLALLEERSRQSIREISALLSANADPSAFIDSLRTRGEQRRKMQDRRSGLLAAEFWLYSLRNPKARRMLAQHQGHLRAAYASAIETVFAELDIAAPAPINNLAAVMMALDEGIFAQHWIDPDAVPAEIFYDTLDLLISSAVALHERQQAGPHLKPL